jgi:predicted TIM-barrel fold metal-dependent hydrolase
MYDPAVIVDCHTHIFSQAVVAGRDALITSDPTFGELYGNPKARLATAEELLASMDESRIDTSIALGFAWRDEALCRRHNDYLLDTADRSDRRILPFCTLPLAAGADAVAYEAERCIAAGALGFGELRPDSLGVDLSGGLAEALAAAAGDRRPLLFHVSEPAGHDYPGKAGFALSAFYRFMAAHPGIPIIAAHWGGGLPFYTLIPEVKTALANCCFDTAATSLLYGDEVYGVGVALAGAEKVLFGSDFPLLSQARSRRRIEETGLALEHRALVLGGNASRILGLT